MLSLISECLPSLNMIHPDLPALQEGTVVRERLRPYLVYSRTQQCSQFSVHTFINILTQSKADSSGSGGAGRLDRKESYKAQKKSYRMQKKRVAKELLSTFKDESIIVLADWLKVRGSLKSWTKLWCVLKPGLLILYKSQKVKSSHWIGTIILSTCELIERPSKKDGFCFKLFHTMDQSIWASRGPEVRVVKQKLNF